MGERLFAALHEDEVAADVETVSRITGMLLEMPHEQLEQCLLDKSARLQQAAAALLVLEQGQVCGQSGHIPPEMLKLQVL